MPASKPLALVSVRAARALGSIGLLAVLSASSARALTSFNVVATTSYGSPPDALLVGEQITLGIRLGGSSGTLGLGASVWGYPLSLVRFVSGEVVGSINHPICHALGCSGGLTNSLAPLEEVEMAPGIGRVRFFQGQSLDPTNTNPLDPGLDGVVGGGDVQFRLTFVVQGIGTTVLEIGTGAPGDGELLAGGLVDQTANTAVQVSVLPEPGSAILLGLGLACLAVRRGQRVA